MLINERLSCMSQYVVAIEHYPGNHGIYHSADCNLSGSVHYLGIY